MNRTLAIIMLDFFVMSSIAFFVLQFISPESDTDAKISNTPSIYRVELAKTDFVGRLDKLHRAPKQLDSVPLQDMIELGFVAHAKGHVSDEISIVTSVDDDGYTIVLPATPKGPFELVAYIRRIGSVSFVLSSPAIVIKGGQSGNAQQQGTLDISKFPAVVFTLGSG